MPRSVAYPPPPLDGLLDLACRDGVDVRPTLLRVLTDLYVQKPVHSAAEERQYVELALGLIDTVDAQTRAIVRDRLAAYPGAPAAVLERLGVSPSADTGENSTVLPEPAADDPIELFFDAAPAERSLILTNLDPVADPQRIRPMTAGEDVLNALERAALAQNIDGFARRIEQALGIDPALARRIAADPSGEPLVVVAKALGMKAAVLQRVLLFLNPAIGHSVERVHRLADLFLDISAAAATYMVSLWRGAGETRRAPHAPVQYDDEMRSARSFASHPARASLREREQPSRIRRTGR